MVRSRSVHGLVAGLLLATNRTSGRRHPAERCVLPTKRHRTQDLGVLKGLVIMKLSSRFSVASLAFALAALSLTGCQKGPAKEEFKKIETACAAKDKEKALEIALAAAESNTVFKKAFDGTFESVSDKKKANICGALPLVELGSRIDNGPMM